MIHDREYIKLLNLVLNHGHEKHDRTGTGTVSVFSPPSSYYPLDDMSIPLLSIKEMKLNSIIHELLWYISGDSNINYLKKNNVNIWNQWADPKTGDLGPVYGYMWRSFTPSNNPLMYKNNRHYTNVDELKNFTKVHVKKVSQTEVWLFDIWQNIPMSKLDKEWRTFDNFVNDVKEIPNWYEAKRFPKSYILYKDFFGTSNVFTKSNTAWVTKEHYDIYHHNYAPVIAKTPYGNKFFLNDFHARLFLCDAYVDTKKDFFINDNYLVRYPPHIDQLQSVIDTLKTNPSSRRMLITSWHPSFLPNESDDPSHNARMGRQALPPCHFEMLWNVNPDNKLNLKLTMRSNDLFLGAPFNIAQYALLLHMVAHVTGYNPGVLTHSIGDAHIYSNHVNQCNLIRFREPYNSPSIRFARKINNINDFKFDDFIIENYNHHSYVKGAVAK